MPAVGQVDAAQSSRTSTCSWNKVQSKKYKVKSIKQSSNCSWNSASALLLGREPQGHSHGLPRLQGAHGHQPSPRGKPQLQPSCWAAAPARGAPPKWGTVLRAQAVRKSEAPRVPPFAIDVPRWSLKLVHVNAIMLHNFHLDQHSSIGAWRRTSTWQSRLCATSCASPPWGQKSNGQKSNGRGKMKISRSAFFAHS